MQTCPKTTHSIVLLDYMEMQIKCITTLLHLELSIAIMSCQATKKQVAVRLGHTFRDCTVYHGDDALKILYSKQTVLVKTATTAGSARN